MSGTIKYIFETEYSQDFIEKVGDDTLPVIGVYGGQAFLSSLNDEISADSTYFKATYSSIPIVFGTLSLPMPVPVESNLYALLSQSALGLYNIFLGNNGNLAKSTKNYDEVTFFVVRSYVSDSISAIPIPGTLNYYVVFLTL